MAVDTDEKRFSMINFYSLDDLLPVPSGGSDVGNRQHLEGLYSGISSGGTTTYVPRLMLLGIG